MLFFALCYPIVIVVLSDIFFFNDSLLLLLDILSYSSKPKRIVQQIKELCSILSCLVIASDYKLGQELFANRDFAANEDYFKMIFELGRRHKVRVQYIM